jgi:toxin ParE1/3/4
MPRIVKHRKAQRDVLLIYVYIGERNLDAADRFLAAFDTDIKRLAAMPLIGAIRTFATPKLGNLRSLPISGFENYLIFYRPAETEVQILRVIHAARDIEHALNE